MLVFSALSIMLDALSGELVLSAFLLLCAMVALITFLVMWIIRKRRK
ncbi:MAG: hypothetical protein IM638_07470 [Bacteroidetes bacterium]|nr:hypothetical protein [Bacteroidota bacterium]